MTDTTPLLNGSNPIVEENMTMQQDFRTWTNVVTRALPVLGEGTPEGNVEALQFTLYIDKNGTTGTTEYRKMLTDIGGDRKQGWVLM